LPVPPSFGNLPPSYIKYLLYKDDGK
jgi:hypothetical protein